MLLFDPRAMRLLRSALSAIIEEMGRRGNRGCMGLNRELNWAGRGGVR